MKMNRRNMLGAAAAGAVLTAAPRVHAEEAIAKPTTPTPKPMLLTSANVLPDETASIPSEEHVFWGHSFFAIEPLLNAKSPVTLPVATPATPTAPAT